MEKTYGKPFCFHEATELFIPAAVQQIEINMSIHGFLLFYTEVEVIHQEFTSEWHNKQKQKNNFRVASSMFSLKAAWDDLTINKTDS